MRRNVAQIKTQAGTYNIERSWESGIYVTTTRDAAGTTMKEQMSDDPQTSHRQFTEQVLWAAETLMSMLPEPGPKPLPSDIRWSLPTEEIA